MRLARGEFQPVERRDTWKRRNRAAGKLLAMVSIATVLLYALVASVYRWHSLPLDVPGVESTIVYERKPMFTLWVGREYRQRLVIDGTQVDLIPQMSPRIPLDMYVYRKRGRPYLYLVGDDGTAVDVERATRAPSRRVDSTFTLLRSVVSIGDSDAIRFEPQSG